FTVVRSHVAVGQSAALPALQGPQIVLVAEGQGQLVAGDETLPLSPGLVYFVCPGTQCTLTAADSALVTYTAHCL
ncbi:hypothetical protein LPJ70_006304, partial [Coemansia sp. RSA 2708]